MYCSRCGKKIKDNSAFCQHCGAKQMSQAPLQVPVQPQIQPQAAYPPRAAQPPIRPVRKNDKGWMIAFFCILGAVVIAFGVFAYLTWLAPKPDVQAMWNGSGIMDADDVFGANFTQANDIQSAEPSVEPAIEPTAQPTEPTAEPTAKQTPEPTTQPTKPTTTPAPTPAPTPVPTPAQDELFAGGLVMDVEGYLGDTWWASAGSSIGNPNAVSAASGYPKVYNLGVGENQYIFHLDTQTIQMLHQEADGSVTDVGEFEYTIDPYGFYLYSFHRTFAIDGKDRDIYSAFFIYDDILYEVEMMDGAEVSNYIAYSIYGP